jgi:hypothetical protein
VRVWFELAPQLGEEDAQVVGFGAVGRAPHLLEQDRDIDDPPRRAGEDLDQSPLGGGEPHLVPVEVPDDAGVEVDVERRGVDDAAGFSRRGWGGAAHGGADP